MADESEAVGPHLVSLQHVPEAPLIQLRCQLLPCTLGLLRQDSQQLLPHACQK